MICDIAPAMIDFSLTGHEGATPHVEHIIVGTVADTLTTAENLFCEGVVKEPLQIITAFLVVTVVGKERGNLNSMVFQCIAGAKQFVLFVVLMEEIYFPEEVSVSATQL